MLFNLNEHQIIIYGAPGTGKSFSIQKELENQGVSDDNIFRVVFHKDYTYSDFVGYIAPNNNLDTITYEYVPGPFTMSLLKAFQDENPVCLLIEEMNRGNCAAIFGDIFQLLDRDKTTGNSEYTIANAPVRSFISEKGINLSEHQNAPELGMDDIYLPNNLTIIATMNTADQNVFTLDSAFKRRFNMKYQPISFESTDQLIKLNSISKNNLFGGVHTWQEFAEYINGKIDLVNSAFYSISEDKKLGPYFVDEVDVSSRQGFCDKVLYYLKNDVFKYSEDFLNISYEKIYDRFVNQDMDIFEIIDKEDKDET